MRITTTAFFNSGGSRLSELQSNLDKLGQQVSSGRKLLTPSQDPSATVRALELSQSASVNAQHENNRQTVRSTLGTMDSALSGMLDTLASMQEQAVAAGNGTVSSTELSYIAQSLDQHKSQLMSLANSNDGAGHFIFSGQSATITPFQVGTDGAVSYMGSTTEQSIAVDASRDMAIGKNGAALFPSTNDQSQNLFAVVDQVVAKLKDPKLTSQDKQTQLQALSQAFTTTRNALSGQQTKVGMELSELEHLDTVGSARALENAETLASLQDLDYNEALSDLARQQLVLQASQKAFSQISNLSLFDYIN